MARIRVVVVDEDGNPQKGVTVAAYSLANFPNIIARQVTDTAGSVIMAVNEVAFYDAFDRRGVSFRDRSYQGRISIQIVSFGNAPCYDYVVDPDGFGTHLTVRAMMADFLVEAAVGPGVTRSCWLCGNDTDKNIEFGATNANVSVATLSIEGAGAVHESDANALTPRMGLIASVTTNDDAYFKTALPKKPRIVFRNVRIQSRFSADTINNAFLTALLTGGGSDNIKAHFYDCDFFVGFTTSTKGVIADGTNAGSGNGAELYLNHCRGSVGGLLRFAAGYAAGDIEVDNCRLTMFALGSNITTSTIGNVTFRGGAITTTGYLLNNASGNGAKFIIQGTTFRHTGASVWFNYSSGQIGNGTNIYMEGLSYSQSSSTLGAVTIAGSPFGGNHRLFIDSCSFLSDSANAATAVVINGSNWLSAQVGTISGPNFAAAVGGTTAGIGLGFYAPPDANYLIGTADARLPSAIVVGLTPGGELGGTWGAITVDTTHSGSPHHTEAHNLLSSPHGDTTAAGVAAGSLVRGNTAGTKWEALAVGANGKVLTLVLGLPEWETPTGGGGGGFLTILTDPVQTEWTNQPAALTELLGLTVHRTKVDLTNAGNVRIVVDVLAAGVAGAKLRAQYSTDAVTWAYFDGATGPEVAIDATGTFASVTVNLGAGAKADVYVRVVGINGNGAADPAFGLIVLQFDTISGGVSVAPPDAKYVTTLASGGLSAEIVRQFLGNYYAETYPGSANAMDDEFDDTAGMSGTINGLNARWTWRNQSTTTATFTPAGYITLTPPSSAKNWRIIEQTKPAAQDYTVEAKLSLEGTLATAVRGGLVVVDGLNGDLYSFEIDFSAGNLIAVAVLQWTAVGGTATFRAGLASAGLGNAAYLRIAYVNSTTALSFWFSADGISWVRVHSVADAVVHTTVGLGVDEENSTGLTKLHCDYFRRIA